LPTVQLKKDDADDERRQSKPVVSTINANYQIGLLGSKQHSRFVLENVVWLPIPKKNLAGFCFKGLQ